MTVTSDLKSATRSHVVGYIAIEGVNFFFFEYSDKGAPGTGDGWSREPKVCLNPPREYSNAIDVGTASPQVSAMTFGLEDVKDSDGTSFFGKLFATGRWTFNPHARTAYGNGLQDQIDANAEYIPLKALGALSANSNGFITRESINWGDTNTNGLLNVGKGLWPSVNPSGTYGYTYSTPPDGEPGTPPHVGSVGFAMNGRRVAYYITTWDAATGAFNSESQSRLVWTGRISNEIQYAGEDDGTWKVACLSITDELESGKIPSALSISHLQKLNCQGPRGLSFKIDYYDSNGALRVKKTITINAGAYTAKELVIEINNHMPVSYTSGGWVDVSVPSNYPIIFVSTNIDKTKHSFFGITGHNEGAGKFVITPVVNGETCHCLGALGFDSRTALTVDASKKDANGIHYRGEAAAPNKTFDAYHPLSQAYNGAKLYVEDADVFWKDQGDANTAQACVRIDDAILSPFGNLSDKEGGYFARYSSRVLTKTVVASNYLVLTTDPQSIISADGYVGQKTGAEKAEVKQIYIPHYRPNVNGTGTPRGPFELLLYPLLSSGTKGYNHAKYDKCPVDLSMAIQSELVDVQSFLQADKFAMGGTSGLGNRKLYIIDKPTTWMELIRRECKLFGYILVWRDGKLAVKSIMHTAGVDTWTNTLDDGTMADPLETPSVSISSGTVVNQYKCKMKYDARQDKFGALIIVTDVDSKLSQGTKEISIEHPGIDFGTNQKINAQKVLESNLLERWIRFPLPVITRSLAPSYVDRVFPADIVKYISSLIPDPHGSGTRTTDCLATVLSSTWDYGSGIGQVMLILHDRKLASAWSPAALVDRTAAGGGFDNAADQVKLVDYTFATNSSLFHDGNAVAEESGWAVKIIERAAADPTNPTTFGPFNTGAAYYSANKYIQLPSGTDMNGWDISGNTEYVVTFSRYQSINQSQFNEGKGTWQADKDSELIASTKIAQVYK
jgi:hypothetical protein